MLIDSHAHLFKEYYSEEEIRDILKSEILVNVVGYNLKSSQEAVELSKQYPFVFSSFGFHPYDVLENVEELESIERYLDEKSVIAIGEIGLDYFRDITPKETQWEAFEKQIEIAKKYNLPIVIHSRDAFSDTISILNNEKYFYGVFHSFDYSKDEVKKVIDMGFYVSFSGMVTFEKRQDLKEALLYVPLDRLLFETDSPYLTPVPLRGKKNSPLFVEYVYRFASKVRNVEFEELTNIACSNFFEIFRKAKEKIGKEVPCLKY